MTYRISTFGKDSRGYYVQEWIYGCAAKGDPSTVLRVQRFENQPARDAYMAQREYNA